MGTLDEIKKMQGEGKSDAEIMQTMKQRGFPDTEILDGLERAKIKSAVSSSMGEPLGPQSAPQSEFGSQEVIGGSNFGSSGYGVQEFNGMQPSMMGGNESEVQAPSQEYQPMSAPPQQQDYGYGNYQQYQPYQESASSDVIEEISEQVVTEKLAVLRDKLEKILDFRSGADAKLASLNDRLMRIEKIIDRLQISVLQRMGEYVSDVKDIKTELQETQKSFKVLHQRSAPAHHAHHPQKHGKKQHP